MQLRSEHNKIGDKPSRGSVVLSPYDGSCLEGFRMPPPWFGLNCSVSRAVAGAFVCKEAMW